MALLKALCAGFGAGSEDKLLNLCKMLWLKDIREYDVFKELFDKALISEKGKLHNSLFPGELDSPIQPDIQKNAIVENTKTKVTLEDYSDKAKIGGDDLTDGEYETVYITMGGKSDYQKIEIGRKILNEGFKYVFSERNFLPYTERPLQVYLRSLKNVVFEPDYESIDINACIEYVSQNGILNQLFYEYKPKNITNLVTIIDIEGSMKIFKWLCNQLTSIISSELTNEVYYYDNLPVPFLFSDTKLKERIGWDIFYKSKLKNKFVIIISDGGAVKGNYNENRIWATIEILEQINQFSKNVVWLNPMPSYRWHNCSAIEISRHVKMFDTSYNGIFNAINYLKNNLHIIPPKSNV